MKKKIRKALSFAGFAKEMMPSVDITSFHESYYTVLELFARRVIRRLIVTMPPQHGKSLGSSVFLPAYMLGLDPDLKVAIGSYSSTLASRFNRRVQRLIDTEDYARMFPETRIKSAGSKSAYVRTSEQFEVVGREGGLISVGREGSLTGNHVDIFILDDLYKDAMEANSPLVRENCWEWYTSVVKTRMHNESSELIVFTRWHEEDLVGRIADCENVELLYDAAQADGVGADRWLHLNLEALKESPPSQLDPRTSGEPLWASRHSRELLTGKRKLNPQAFEALYQGKPSNKDGLLYGDNFGTYARLPEKIVKRANYTDTSDMGDDYLCSVCYEVADSGIIYVTDIVYSRAKMEITERLVADMLDRNQTRQALVESNNGGRGFARAVGRHTSVTRMEWFHQSANKEARILSNSATVLRYILMPEGWDRMWDDFAHHLRTYKRVFKANRWHDAPDVLTGIVEREVVDSLGKKIKALGFSQR